MCLSNERTFPYSPSSLDPDLGRRLISTARLRNYRPTLRVKKIMGKESTKGLGVTKTLTVIKQLSQNPLVFGVWRCCSIRKKSRSACIQLVLYTYKSYLIFDAQEKDSWTALRNVIGGTHNTPCDSTWSLAADLSPGVATVTKRGNHWNHKGVTTRN